MKKRDLDRHLTQNGCHLQRQGKHEIWANPSNGRRSPVPRHREIPSGTVKSICAKLRIPIPVER